MKFPIIDFKRIIRFFKGPSIINLWTESQMLEAFKFAAEKGDAIALFNLGLSYYHGKGVLQDYAQAVYWYRKAAEQGYPDAKEILEKEFEIKV